MSKNDIKPVGRKADIVIQEYGSEILIYDLLVHKAFSLNETSALVWRACDGVHTVSDISGHISRQLSSPVTEDFVWLALEQLKKDNLLENTSEVSTDFGGLSRREVIRRIGLATLVALPIVSSLVAPTAAQAQSAACVANACLCPPGTPPAGFCNTTQPGAATSTNPGVVVCGPTAAPAATPVCRCTGPFAAANPPSGGGAALQRGNCRIFP